MRLKASRRSSLPHFCCQLSLYSQFFMPENLSLSTFTHLGASLKKVPCRILCWRHGRFCRLFSLFTRNASLHRVINQHWLSLENWLNPSQDALMYDIYRFSGSWLRWLLSGVILNIYRILHIETEQGPTRFINFTLEPYCVVCLQIGVNRHINLANLSSKISSYQKS